MNKLYIKYMVSLRCKMLVKDELTKLGINYFSVELGMVELMETMSSVQLNTLKSNLKKSGLIVLDNKEGQIVDQVKNSIDELFVVNEEEISGNFSQKISEQIGFEYTYLSKIYSEVNGHTIQQYFIESRIKRVKEMLLYENSSLSMIAFQLKYSSVGHLCNQFKKITGMTPSHFLSSTKKVKLLTQYQ